MGGYEPVPVTQLWVLQDHRGLLFRKDKMSPNTAVIYYSEESANRALSQIYHGNYKAVQLPLGKFPINQIVYV